MYYTSVYVGNNLSPMYCITSHFNPPFPLFCEALNVWETWPGVRVCFFDIASRCSRVLWDTRDCAADSFSRLHRIRSEVYLAYRRCDIIAIGRQFRSRVHSPRRTCECEFEWALHSKKIQEFEWVWLCKFYVSSSLSEPGWERCSRVWARVSPIELSSCDFEFRVIASE